jgi:hypothetical protein
MEYFPPEIICTIVEFFDDIYDLNNISQSCVFFKNLINDVTNSKKRLTDFLWNFIKHFQFKIINVRNLKTTKLT